MERLNITETVLDMLQTDFTIIIIILNSLTFFALGYWVANRTRRNETQREIQGNPQDIGLSLPQDNVSQYRPDDVRLPIDEPSGVIYRPTAQELKKMNEDEATKQEKEAVAALFRQGAVT